MNLQEILSNIELLDEEDQNILLLNLLYKSKIFTESNKDNIVNLLLNSKKEDLINKTLFTSNIIKVKQKNSTKLITKILDNLDEVCNLYEKIKYGERTSLYDFNMLLNPIVDICKSNKCNLVNNTGTHLLSILLTYYIDHPILQKSNNYSGSYDSIEYIIELLVNNKNLIISYEELSKSLINLYYDRHEERYEHSLYKEIKNKVIELNKKRNDKSIYTFWDFYDDIEELIILFEDSYSDDIDSNDKFLDEEYEYEYTEDDETLYDETIKFVDLYNKMIEIFKSEKCNLKDDKGNTMLTHMLSKYYCDGFNDSIKYKGIEYSIKDLIITLIHNDKLDLNKKNLYNIDILQMAKIIKKSQINYEEHNDICAYIERDKNSNKNKEDDEEDNEENDDDIIIEISNILKK